MTAISDTIRFVPAKTENRIKCIKCQYRKPESDFTLSPTKAMCDRCFVICRRANLKKRYGITLEEFEAMFEAQNGVCAICEKPCSKWRNLSVDHCHKTGRVRGLLCDACNQILHKVGDSTEMLRKCIEYLSERG